MTHTLFAYKYGDVQSGNWQWAVGSQSRMASRRPYNIATINFYGCNATGLDHAYVAELLASAPELLDLLHQARRSVADRARLRPAERELLEKIDNLLGKLERKEDEETD